ncbi:MAG: hypothetical protein QXO69_00620 [archaeon]
MKQCLNDRAQVSVEYLILAGVGLIVAVLITALAYNIFSIKDGIKQLIESYRSAFIITK